MPVIAQVTIEIFGTMLNGTEIGAALTALEPFPIDVIGMNCGTGPKQMADSFRYLCENSPMPVSVLPNAGLARGEGRKAALRRNAGKLCGAGRAFCERFWGEYRRRLLRHVAGAYSTGDRACRQRFAEAAKCQACPVGLVDLFSAAVHAGRFVPDRRRARERFGLEEDARPARRGGLGRARQSREVAGERRRSHSRRQRRLCRP